MKHVNAVFPPLAAAMLILGAFVSTAATAQTTVAELQTAWAVTNYELEGDARLDAFEQLQAAAEQYTADHPKDPDGWIWSGIIKSTFAGAKGGLGALGLAKAARKDLDTAIRIDGDAMHGSAYTSLGTLYANVPGWPVGFGSDKKAEQMLKKGLELNPDGIDSNYFYGEFLRDQGQRDEAARYYRKARSASPRAGRPVADAGRQREIDAALAKLGSS